MNIFILILGIFFSSLAFSANSCNLSTAEEVYASYSEIFMQIDGINAWGVSIDCQSGFACLHASTATWKSLKNIVKIFPNGLTLKECEVEFSYGGPIELSQ